MKLNKYNKDKEKEFNRIYIRSSFRVTQKMTVKVFKFSKIKYIQTFCKCKYCSSEIYPSLLSLLPFLNDELKHPLGGNCG